MTTFSAAWFETSFGSSVPLTSIFNPLLLNVSPYPLLFFPLSPPLWSRLPSLLPDCHNPFLMGLPSSFPSVFSQPSEPSCDRESSQPKAQLSPHSGQVWHSLIVQNSSRTLQAWTGVSEGIAQEASPPSLGICG